MSGTNLDYGNFAGGAGVIFCLFYCFYKNQLNCLSVVLLYNPNDTRAQTNLLDYFESGQETTQTFQLCSTFPSQP